MGHTRGNLGREHRDLTEIKRGKVTCEQDYVQPGGISFRKAEEHGSLFHGCRGKLVAEAHIAIKVVDLQLRLQTTNLKQVWRSRRNE